MVLDHLRLRLPLGVDAVKRIKRSNGATRARNVRRYGYSASRAPCHTVLLGAAPAVFQPRGQAIPKVGIIKKVARSIQSNATVQVLPGLAGDVPSPSLIMRTKGQQNVKANGLNSLPIVEQPALSISTSGASSPAKTQDGGSRLRTLGPA